MAEGGFGHGGTNITQVCCSMGICRVFVDGQCVPTPLRKRNWAIMDHEVEHTGLLWSALK